MSGLGGAEALEELAPGKEGGAHLKGDARGHLDIEESEAAGAEMLDEVVEGGFGGVGNAVEHGFAGEVSADGYAVDAADQFVVLPEFEAMGVASAVEVGVCGDEFGSDPGGAPVRGGARTFGHDLGKRAVHGDLERLLAKKF